MVVTAVTLDLSRRRCPDLLSNFTGGAVNHCFRWLVLSAKRNVPAPGFELKRL